MDKKELNYEFMSIISESHPGLTFEEYRDSCVFLLFYHYLCLRFNETLEDSYKLPAMVRLAVRGKLQMPAFVKFIDQASSFLHLAGSPFYLTDLSFYQKLLKVHQIEKQKSFARFFRKLIKKMDSWDCDALLLESYGTLFEQLMCDFARTKKETFISDELMNLLKLVFESKDHPARRVFLPDFKYGILLQNMVEDFQGTEIFGYDDQPVYVEILRILCFMNNLPEESVHLYSKEQWFKDKDYLDYFDAMSILAPEGAEPGSYIASVPDDHPVSRFLHSGTKGELPMILSALPLLGEEGTLAVVTPSALLYREGKEAQIRRYLVEEAGCLALVMLLPDHIFQSTGQNEVLLLFRKKKQGGSIMFFDCSEMESIDEEGLNLIRRSWEKAENISGFCASVDIEKIRENEYNLNLPRYVTRLMKLTEVDLKAKLERISQIDQELDEIERRISMYRRDLELGFGFE